MESFILPYSLIVISLLLMAVELIVPANGILFIVGIGGLVVGSTVLISVDALQGLATVIGLFIILPILGPILLQYWRRTPLGRRMVLEGPDEDSAAAHLPVQLELQHLLGRYGKTLSALRPSGIVEIDGKRIDALSEGPFIKPGQSVKCVDVKAGRVLVRAVEKPPTLEDLNDGDLLL